MDKIKQVGNYMRKTRQQGDFTVRRYNEIFPLVERVRDNFDSDFPFKMEFKTKIRKNQILLDLNFNMFSPCNCEDPIED